MSRGSIAAQRPNGTIDDALARARTVQAPAFELEVLDPGRMPGHVIGAGHAVMRQAAGVTRS